MSEMNTAPDTNIYDFTSNGDGTHSGVKLAQFLMEALTKKPCSEDQAREIIAEAQARAKAKQEAQKCEP